MTAAVQLPLDGLPLDPVEVARLDILSRSRLYTDLKLMPEQRECIETAVRLIRSGSYRKAGL
jgi:hypothetical protein